MRFSWWIPFLALAPAAFVLYWLNTHGATAGTFTDALFIVSLLALIPLAQLNSALVERLARGAPKVFSGLLNACLDNIPEISIGFWLLLQVVRHSDPELLKTNFTIVRGLLLGSVIENILFTLGAATIIGALRHGKLRFSREKAAGFASMLGLAVVGLALPTLATSFASEEARTASTEEWVTIAVSAILMISYIAYVAVEVFGVGDKASAKEEEAGPATTSHHEAHHAHEEGHSSAAAERELAAEHQEIAARALAQEKLEAQEKAAPQRSFGATAGLLLLVVISIAAIAGVCATLVTVSDRVIAHTPITPLSFGLIILPFVTNFGELLEACRLAFRKDMEAAMEVAAGSSVQVPLFVTPVIVFLGVIFAAITPNLPALTLIFPGLALITLGLAAFVYALVNLDGETTWLEGAQLIVFYAMIAITAFALPGA